MENSLMFGNLTIEFVRCEENDDRLGTTEVLREGRLLRVYFGVQWNPFIRICIDGSSISITREFWEKYGGYKKLPPRL